MSSFTSSSLETTKPHRVLELGMLGREMSGRPQLRWGSKFLGAGGVWSEAVKLVLQAGP